LSAEAEAEVPNHRQCSLLCPRPKRPSRCAAESRDKFPPPHRSSLQPLHQKPIPAEDAHVTEYLKLAEGGKVLEVNNRIEDPGTFNAPWSAIQRYRQVQRPWLEEDLQFGYHTPIANKSDSVPRQWNNF
jgi:hypothetical protein